MKKFIKYTLPALVLFYSSLFGQGGPADSKSDPNAHCEFAAYGFESKGPPKYKVESVMDKAEFFATKQTFDAASEYDSIYIRSANGGAIKKAMGGIAKVMSDNSRVQIVYFNYATAGTVLKLTNPQNGRMIYAMVVGKIPPSESSCYLLVVSDMAARKLLMKDYSTVELTYFLPVP